MVAHRVDKGTVSNPLMAGDPLRLDVTATTTSGAVGSATVAVDFSDAQRIAYALFAMVGDAPVASPSFVLEVGSGVTVVNALGGLVAFEMTASQTALWTGRDWHAAKMVDVMGQPFELFDGIVVSTRARTY